MKEKKNDWTLVRQAGGRAVTPDIATYVIVGGNDVPLGASTADGILYETSAISGLTENSSAYSASELAKLPTLQNGIGIGRHFSSGTLVPVINALNYSGMRYPLLSGQAVYCSTTVGISAADGVTVNLRIPQRKAT